MSEPETYHGGLIYLEGTARPDLEEASVIVAQVLGAFCHRVERRTVLNAGRARVATSGWEVRLSLRDLPPPTQSARRRVRLDRASRLAAPVAEDWPSHRLVLRFRAADPARVCDDHAQRLLAETLRRLTLTTQASLVEWRDPSRRVPGDTFAPAMAQLELPVCAGARPRFAPVEGEATRLARHWITPRLSATEAVLARALAPQTPPPLRRVATWGMTAVIATISGPVGISVAAVNLIRGEDLRLNTHVLSLAGAITVLHSSGALAQAVAALPV